MQTRMKGSQSDYYQTEQTSEQGILTVTETNIIIMMIKRSIHQEDIKLLDMYTPNKVQNT